MPNHYQATTDKVIALIPPRPAESEMVGVLHLPPNFDKRKLRTKDSNAIAEAVAHSVGPDCKTVKAGDTFLYNWRNFADPALPCDDGELVLIPEASVIAVVKSVPQAEAKPTIEGTEIPAPDRPLTVESIRAALIQQEKSLQETPAEPPTADAQLAQKTP